MKNETHKTPWYREPLVWLIIAIPLSAVLAGITMLGLAISSYDGLVADDYYVRGMEINRQLGRDRRAAETGLAADIDIDYQTSELNIALSATSHRKMPEIIEVQFLHPVRSGLDHKLELFRNVDGRFHGKLPELIPGRWIVQVGTPQWRLVGAMRIPNRDTLTLRPQ